MEEALFRLWEVIERAGVASAIIMSVWLYYTRQDMATLRSENESLRRRNDEIQDQRIEDNKTLVTVVEKSTQETRSMADLVKALPSMMGRSQ